MDELKEKYILITAEEVKNCHIITDKRLICKQTFPIFTALNSKVFEVNVLRMTNITNECNFRKVLGPVMAHFFVMMTYFLSVKKNY